MSEGTDKIVADIPMKRLGLPEEVADTIFYLCSKEASYVSGAEIEINGGGMFKLINLRVSKFKKFPKSLHGKEKLMTSKYLRTFFQVIRVS